MIRKKYLNTRIIKNNIEECFEMKIQKTKGAFPRTRRYLKTLPNSSPSYSCGVTRIMVGNKNITDSFSPSRDTKLYSQPCSEGWISRSNRSEMTQVTRDVSVCFHETEQPTSKISSTRLPRGVQIGSPERGERTEA